MALSRLRQHSFSSSRFLIEARLFSSSTCRISANRIRNIPLPDCFNHESSMIRALCRSSSVGIKVNSHKLKVVTSMRLFSSNAAEIPSHTFIEMPALSPTMTQGNISKWRKKEGDKISVGDVFCEIETDKATLEFESLEEGFLAKILVPEGSKDVLVGQPIAITVEDADEMNSVLEKVASEIKVTKDKSVTTNHEVEGETLKASSASLGDSELPPHFVLEMPALSPTMNQGNITKWRKNEGDKVEVGDVICEIETDKATLEFESLEEGYIAKILVPEGSKDVLVGSPIVVTVEDPNDIGAVKACKIGMAKSEEKLPVSSHSGQESHDNKTIFFKRISPSAKLLIAEYGLDTSSVKASGPHDTLLKGDILAAINSGRKAPKNTQAPHAADTPRPTQSPVLTQPGKSDSYIDIPNSQIRKIIARRLLESKQNTPHLYMSSDVTLDPLLSFRKELSENYGVKVSVNDIVIKIVAVSLKNVPEANAYWNVEKEEITLCESVDISIAVATEKGLMTPIIRNTDYKSILAISSEIKVLAEKARSGKLAPNEFQGGSFSISNLGMFPVDRFCAIINPPQACILAVGRGNKVVDVVAGDDGVDKPAVVTKMSLTLSADHRVFDGRVGGLFLSELGENFNNIRKLLV